MDSQTSEPRLQNAVTTETRGCSKISLLMLSKTDPALPRRNHIAAGQRSHMPPRGAPRRRPRYALTRRIASKTG